MLLLALAAALGSAADAAPPNVVLILTDDMRRSDLEYMPFVQDLLVEAGTSFSAAYVNVALCCPSRATLLRGQYSHNTRIFTNAAPGGGFEKFWRSGLERETVATALERAGYSAGFFGKYLNGYPGSAGWNHIPPGWSDWAVPIAGNANRGFGYTILEPFEPYGMLPIYHGTTAADYATDVFFARARDFVSAAEAGGTPFFVFLSLFAPHLPATPAPRHARLFPDLGVPRGPAFSELDVSDKPRFISRLKPLKRRIQKKIDGIHRRRVLSLQAVDEGVAALVDHLAEIGELESTYIVFTSDNGFHLGDHRMGWGKQSAYEVDIGVPLVVRGPGVPAGATVDALVLNTDLAPTLTDIAGSELAYEPDGRSLLPWLAGPEDAPPVWRESVLVDLYEGKQRDPGDGKIRIPPFHGIRSRRYLYVEYQTGERELYDHQRDPEQIENAIGSADPTLLQALSERIAALRTCLGVTCRALEDAPLP